MSNGLINAALGAVGLWRGKKRQPEARYRTLGDEARDRGDWMGAVVNYRTFLQRNPGNFAIWVQLGHASKEAGQLSEAEEAYKRAEMLDPEDADLALNLGHLMKAQRRRSEAATYYARSFDLNGNVAARAELAALGIKPKRDLTARAKSREWHEKPFVGAVDVTGGAEVRGWAIEPDPSNGPAEIEVVSEGRVIATAVASRRRADLVEAGFPDMPAGFSAFIDADELAGNTILADVRLKSTGDLLEGSPLTIHLPGLGENSGEGSVTAVRYAVAKPLGPVSGEHAIFVAYAPTGMLQPFVRRYLAMLVDQGIAVSLVVNAERPVLLDEDLLGMLASAVVRENRGYDFGAWAHMLRIEPRLYGASALYIANDSVFGPRNADTFKAMIAAMRANPADLVGPTQSLERGWHIQSYFLRIGRALLASYGFQFFVNGVTVILDKDRIIDSFEVPLTDRVREAGFEADAIYKPDEARNPTLYAWRELLDLGFPFAKLLLLRGAFKRIKSKGLAKALARAGFDARLLDATLAYRSDDPPLRGDWPLLARKPHEDPRKATPPAKPYKVAFYGPWNYDNGLGFASRGAIAALRHAGVRLNLHPIKTPFHIHKPLAPPHDVVDFDGDADIAVVHLNPDSWHLLTDEQRRAIGRAGKRIGYWVWEMEHLPPLWRREFSSVDRIWAASGYNAGLFIAQDEAQVDIVPHAVPVDAAAGMVDRAALLSRLALPTDRRLILYVFDGASYLVRKNPHALVRAFAASGLAARGWSLVLKTKHLMDRAADGRALAALAEATEGVVLLDRSLTAGELAELVAICDIYASPHCAEGFGLTVAEAMAAGRSVVATDYSGTTQFLDASCGYPVPAEPWTLEEDHGHYTKGGTWARIDEAALAARLVEAAERIDAGDTSIGEAARARIASALSYEAVGAAMAASFDAAVGETIAVRRTPPRIDDGGAAGVPLARFDGGETIAVLPLRAGTLQPTRDARAAVADAADRWLLLAPEDAALHPLAARILARHAALRPDVAIFHADDVAFGAPTLLDQVRLKPVFDQTLFAAQDYIGAPLFVRGSALHELGGLRDRGDATLYDLVLRAAERGMAIGRIPDVLMLLDDERVIAPAEARRTLIEASPLYAGYAALPGLTANTLRLASRFATGRPDVTLCIPTRRSALPDAPGTYIERLLDSLVQVDWPSDRLHVIVGDDVTGVPDWERRDWPFRLTRIETTRAPGEPFNYSAKMNRLWRAADSEIVVLMNDDVVAHDGDWLAAMVGFATDSGIGGVGARLLFDDGTIQHAGTVGGVLGTSVHAWLGRRAGARTYQDWAIVQREWSMVTGALFATRKGVLDAIGGFDEGFSLEFNDIDLCLKIRQAGWRIVYTPFAELTHSEKASRGESVPPGEQTALFLSRWQGWLAEDPALPPRMRRDMLDLTPSAGRGDWFV